MLEEQVRSITPGLFNAGDEIRASCMLDLLSSSPSPQGKFLKRHQQPRGLTAPPGFPLPSLTLMMTASFPTPLRMLYQMPRGEADGISCGLVYGLWCPGSAWVGPTLQELGQLEGHPRNAGEGTGGAWGTQCPGCTVLPCRIMGYL